MKSRIRRISASVDTAISFGGSSNSNTTTSASNTSTVQSLTTTQSSATANHHSGPSLAGMSNFGQNTSQDSALGSTTNTSIDQPFFVPSYNNSRSLDIQCVPESRIEKMRKLLSSPLLRKRNPSHCHHSHSHHSSNHSTHQHSQNMPIQQNSSAGGQAVISRDVNSSPSSSPSSSPALIGSASMRTFGISLESLAHHRHPHHKQATYDGQAETEEFYYRDPELVVVPHQKAAHILGQACAGCLTSAPSNSSSMGSIHESTSSGAVHHPYDESIPASTSPGTSSSSTTSSTSSAHGCGQGSTSHYMIPFIVTRLCNYIESQHGLSHEGLFRVSGNARLVERLKKSFDETGDAPLESEADLSSASTLLKTFLRELPHPLISNGAQFLEVVRSLKKNHDTCVLALKALVSQLPDENYFTLRYLIRFLYKISLKNEENRMSATNLGIVFAPNLFRVCIDTYQGLADQSTANEVVHLLITEFNEIFGEGQCSVIAAEMSHDDLSIEMQEYPFGHPEFEEEPTKDNDEEYSAEETCSRSLIDFRSDMSSDVDRKRKDFQCGVATRSNIEVFYDHSSETPSDSYSPPRSQSVEMEMDSNLKQVSDNLKSEPEVGSSVKVKSSSGASNLIKSGNRAHADIIVTNSSDSVSTDDNTATTATSAGATVCSVIIGASAPKGRNLEPGSAHMKHFSSSGDEAQDRSGSLPIKMARSGSCSSDCTENQHLKINLSDDDGNGNGSLSHSIASDCLTDDGEESDSTTSSILDGTSGNEAGSSSSMNEPEPEALKEDITKLAEELSIEEVAYNCAVFQPSTTPPLIDFESPGHSRSDSVRSRQNKRFSSIRRKLKEFETVFKEENGYEPSFDHKMASSFARPLMLEMSTLLNVATPSLRDIDLDAADPSKTDHYREPSPTRSSFNARQQTIASLNKRFLIRGLGQSTGQSKLIPKNIPPSSIVVMNESGNPPVPIDPALNSNPSTSKTENSLTEEEIFSTIIGNPAEKHLQIIRETMIYIEDRNRERRSKACCPEDLDSMTQEQILDEKLALQRALLRFEALHGRPSTPAERNIVRHVYDRYREVKRRAANIRGDKPTSSNQISLPSRITASTSAMTLAAGDLPPIIENVQMNFQSPTTQVQGPILLEFDAEKNRTSSPDNSVKKLQKSYHEMSQERLMKELQDAKQQKRSVRMVLRTFERDFFKRTGRKVEKEDRCNVSAGYNAYRHLRYKTRLIQALIKKNQELKKSLSKTDDRPEVGKK